MSIINSQIATNTKFDASVRNGLESSRADSAVKGSYRGETVRVHNATQSLFDAMEELTSLGSEKAEKDLTKRKIKDGGVTKRMSWFLITLTKRMSWFLITSERYVI